MVSMVFLLIFCFLWLLEIAYFKIADRFNIIDKPNARSSHTLITLRGGGVIFPLSVLVYYFGFGFHYSFFVIGMIAIAAISFLDDISHQPKKLRAIVQFVSVSFLLYSIGLFKMPVFWWPIAYLLVIGVVNAYNFMDGINGITTAYSFTILGALYLLNNQLQLFDQNLVYCLTLGNLVFAFFNFRKKARCFAGDVGSVSMAYALLFLTSWCIMETGNPIFILFFAVYGIDTVLTIAHRMMKKENIFEAHRQHLFQMLSNEKKIPQLWVSSLYFIIQALVSLCVLWIWQKEASTQWLFAGLIMIILSTAYLLAKLKILRDLKIAIY